MPILERKEDGGGSRSYDSKNPDIFPFISFMEINQWRRDSYRDRLIGKDFQIRKYIGGNN